MSGIEIATWLGTLGGLAGAYFTYRALRGPKFRPSEKALVDEDRRILVKLTNRGGAGSVEDVNLLLPNHEQTKRVEPYHWEMGGQRSDRRPVPFSLEGHSTANLFLLPDAGVPLAGLRVRVEYVDGDSGCLTITPVKGRLYGTTYIPGMV